MASSWRSLERMEAYQVPIILGGILAAIAGVATYVLSIGRRAGFAPGTEAVFLIVLGVLGVIAYAVSKTNVRNGVIVAGVSGLGLIVLGGGAGLWTGLVVLAGAILGFARSA
jgi:hypothetical protein